MMIFDLETNGKKLETLSEENCNVALHHYQGAYFATQRLKQADCWQLPPSQPTATN